MLRRLSMAALAISAASVMGVGSVGFGATVPAGTSNRVLVIPFVSLNTPTDKQWISKAVQETMIADLGQTSAFVPVAFSGQVIVEDNATAAKLARDATTAYAVRGSTQFVNNDVRLTAQMIDAKTGDTVATAIATGRVDDLLKLEDDLANQLRVGPAPAAEGYTSTGTGYVPRSANPPPAQPMQAMQQPAVYNAPVYNDNQAYGTPAYYYSPVYSPSYLDYTTYQYVPSYSYPYYPIYPITFFSFNNGFHGHFHDGFHGGFHSGFGSGFHGSFGMGGHGGHH